MYTRKHLMCYDDDTQLYLCALIYIFNIQYLYLKPSQAAAKHNNVRRPKCCRLFDKILKLKIV